MSILNSYFGLLSFSFPARDLVAIILGFGWLVTLVSLEFVYFQFGMLTSKVYAILPARDWDAFGGLCITGSIYCILAMIAKGASKGTAELVSRAMRRNLTHHLHRIYLQKQALHDSVAKMDNPDQRMTEDVIGFTSRITKVAEIAFMVPPLIAYYSQRTWHNVGLMGLAAIYGHFLVGLLMVSSLMRRLKAMNLVREQREANFRAEHRNLVTRHESVLLTSPEVLSTVRRQMDETRFEQVLSVLKRLIITEAVMEGLAALFSYSGTILVFGLLGWELALGRWTSLQDTGEIAQQISRTSFAALYLSFQLSRITALSEPLAALNAHVHRLAELVGVIDQSSQRYVSRLFAEKWSVCVEKLNWTAPRQGSALFKNLSLSIKPHAHVLVVGPNGSGKSTLMRLVCGLWQGEGIQIVEPSDQSRPYLGVCPQSPAVFSGSILDQLGIDETDAAIEESELRDIFKFVGLAEALSRFDVRSFVSIDTWHEILTAGQLQRLALARIFWHRPHLAILDETFASISLEESGRFVERLFEQGSTIILTDTKASLSSRFQHTILLPQSQNE